MERTVGINLKELERIWENSGSYFMNLSVIDIYFKKKIMEKSNSNK